MQQYEKRNGSYSQEEMLQFDKDKLIEAKGKLNCKHPFEREVALAEVQILERCIKERLILIMDNEEEK